MNTGSEGKNTIEFRLANGTTDPETWIENINLFGGLVKSAQELAEIQKKPENEKTESDYKKLAFFDKVNDPEASEKEVLDALLSLTVAEEDKYIYEERYEVNNELFKENEELTNMMNEQSATSKIIPKKDIKDIAYQSDAEKVDEATQVLGNLVLQDRQQNNEEKKKQMMNKRKEAIKDVEERE